MTLPITPEQVRDALLRRLQKCAEGFMRDGEQAAEFDRAVEAVNDFVRFNSVTLDTLSKLFNDDGKEITS